MPISKKDVMTIKQEYLCDDCGKGVYRLVHDLPVTNTNPKQYKHACSNCQKETMFTLVYPTLIYQEQTFMLADSLRYQSKAPGVSTSNK